MNILESTKVICLNTLSFIGSKLRRTPLARSTILNQIHVELSLWLHDSKEVQIGDFKVRIDPRDRFIAKKLILYNGYEKHEISLLCSLVRTGDCVLDIGANIGLYSLHLSRAVGSEGRVIAVEPDPDNQVLLRTNLEKNNCTNVTIVPFAFGDKTDSVQLFQVNDNRGYLSFADLGKTGKSVTVEVKRGETVLEDLKVRPTIAKIDVEGAEPLVLSGLGNHKPNIILFEFVPEQLRALNQNPRKFLDWLIEEGYTLELIDPDSGERSQHEPYLLLKLVEKQVSKEYNILARRSKSVNCVVST